MKKLLKYGLMAAGLTAFLILFVTIFWRYALWTLGTLAALALIIFVVRAFIKRSRGAKKSSLNWDFLRVAIGWTLLSAAAILFLVWNDKRADKEKIKQADARQGLAARLRYAVILPDREVRFVLHAGKTDSPIYKVREQYCTRTEPLNLGETYVLGTQRGEFLVSPADEKVIPTGRVEFFYARAYGGPTADISVQTYKKAPNGECKGPTRNS